MDKCGEMKPLFIHIPKNAGTSVRTILSEHYYYPEWIKSHHTQLQLEARCQIHGYQPDFTFCIVRNPYDRLVSIFHYLKKRCTHQSSKLNPSHVAYKNFLEFNFKQFVKFYLTESSTTYFLINSHHFLPQTSFLDSPNSIEVFKFEDLTKLENVLNYRLPHINHLGPNESGFIDYMLLYNDETLRIVNEYYKLDFKRFGYHVC